MNMCCCVCIYENFSNSRKIFFIALLVHTFISIFTGSMMIRTNFYTLIFTSTGANIISMSKHEINKKKIVSLNVIFSSGCLYRDGLSRHVAHWFSNTQFEACRLFSQLARFRLHSLFGKRKIPYLGVWVVPQVSNNLSRSAVCESMPPTSQWVDYSWLLTQVPPTTVFLFNMRPNQKIRHWSQFNDSFSVDETNK